MICLSLLRFMISTGIIDEIVQAIQALFSNTEFATTIALVATLVSAVPPLVRAYLSHIRSPRKKQTKIIVSIDGKNVTIKLSNPKEADAIVRRFAKLNPKIVREDK